MTQETDVFVDLTDAQLGSGALSRLVERWIQPENLGAIARRVHCVGYPGQLADLSLPPRPGWSFEESASPIEQLSAALTAADSAGIPLLVVLDAVDTSCEAVAILQQCLQRDPLFGFSLPRVRCAEGCCLVCLSQAGVDATEWVARRILADLPETELVGEISGPCILVGPEVRANFGALDSRFDGVAAAMLHYMARARRHGFRTVVSNRAVVGVHRLRCDTPTVPPLLGISAQDDTLLHELVPDLERGWQEFRGGSWERFERLYAANVNRRGSAARRSLLLDLRNLSALHNGTSHAVLGTAQGLRRLNPNWEVNILATSAGAAFHDLEHTFGDWPVFTEFPHRQFTLALRLSQPWHIQDMIDLHDLSLFNAYMMLDTIAWDVVYAAPHHLDGTWRFLADHADALLFDSDFTRQRFDARFPTHRGVPSLVTRFSFDPGEYVLDGARGSAADEPFVLVMGNSLDHKDVGQTVETLATAFPFRHIRVLGPAPTVSPFVSSQHSGHLSEINVHRLYAHAQFVVFPSFYEGFGFPIVTALSYGRTVLARRSSLVDELAAECSGHGRLIVYENREGLVDLIGRLTHGELVPEEPLGAGLAGHGPRTWRDVAHDMVEFLEPLVGEPSRSRWIAREHLVRQLTAYRT